MNKGRDITSKRVEVKRVGKSGQISLGKRYAGKIFCVQQGTDGSLLLTAVAMVPESLLWTLRERDRSAIIRGMTWAASAPPAETDLETLAADPKGEGEARSQCAPAKLPMMRQRPPWMPG